MEQLLFKLAETSILGILLALSVFANYLLFNVIRDLQNQRVEDAQEARDSILEPIKAVKQSIDLLITLVQNKEK